MATSPRNNPAGLYLRLPLLREEDPAADMPLRVLVKSLVHQPRVMQNYRQRRGHRALARC
jgi:hypothetical protein